MAASSTGLSDASNAATPFAACRDGLRLAVRLTPRAAANRVGGTVADAAGGRRLKVAVTAVPEAGKANAALIRLLAKMLKVPKSSLSIQSGASDRNKTVLIAGDAATLESGLRDAVERL